MVVVGIVVDFAIDDVVGIFVVVVEAALDVVTFDVEVDEEPTSSELVVVTD